MPRTIQLFILTILASALTPIDAGALNLFGCDPPREPYCLDLPFDNEYTARSCRLDTERFIDQTTEYITCLRDKADEATKASNDVVEKYNCKSRGGHSCR